MRFAINGATTMPYTLEEDVLAAAGTGFQGVEIWWGKLVRYQEKHSLSELRALLSDNALAITGLCPFLVSPFRNTESLRADFQQALHASGEIGCDLITVCPDFRPMELSREEAFKRHADAFAWHAEQAAKAGVRLCIEPIARHTLIPGPMEALALIKSAGDPENLGVLMDTFHYMCSGISPDTIRAIPLEKLWLVHANDSERGAVEELKDEDRLYPTEGYIDLKADMDALVSIGYDGYLSVEVFRPAYWRLPIGEINRRARESLDRLLAL
jgi:2-keto-myo-inositol isomerase